ncbi:MAG: hypothetical protein ABEI52_01290, partial [Halobacteriaceae archaeon]
MSTNAGKLSLDRESNEFVFSAKDPGTYKLFWIVRKPVGANGSVRTTKFVAYIRVAGRTNLVHISQQEFQQRQYYAQLGREVNETIKNLRDRNLIFADNHGSDREIFQAMVTRFVATGNPLRALTG